MSFLTPLPIQPLGEAYGASPLCRRLTSLPGSSATPKFSPSTFFRKKDFMGPPPALCAEETRTQLFICSLSVSSPSRFGPLSSQIQPSSSQVPWQPSFLPGLSITLALPLKIRSSEQRGQFSLRS